MNPNNCFKIIDAVIFILLLNENDFKYLKEKGSLLANLYDFN